MIFSSLSNAFPEKINHLYSARDVILARGEKILDFISGNVNQYGIVYPEAILNEVLQAAVPQARVYRPDSFGQSVTRQAICDYYEAQAVRLRPEEILVTPGTSISYFYCIKLLANNGDEILCPSPSYPLFETIARLSDVQLTSYRLREANGWEIDLDYLESRFTSRTRAIVVISPHNPTGMVASEKQLGSLAEIAQRHQLPIIADEVFSEFLFEIQTLPRPALTPAPLVFTLNGLSKMLALPGMKLGWMAVSGDPTLVKKSMRALEMISDTFLPVNELVQFITPEILKRGAEFLAHYKGWVRQCRDLALDAVSQCPNLKCVPPSGGFYLAARILGAERDEDDWVIDILDQCKVLVHPGYFYEIPPTHFVMTFVQESDSLREGLARLCKLLDWNLKVK